MRSFRSRTLISSRDSSDRFDQSPRAAVSMGRLYRGTAETHLENGEEDLRLFFRPTHVADLQRRSEDELEVLGHPPGGEQLPKGLGEAGTEAGDFPKGQMILFERTFQLVGTDEEGEDVEVRRRIANEPAHTLNGEEPA